MAGREGDIATKSDDADDSADNSTAGQLLSSDDVTGLRDSGSDQDEESELDKIPFLRRRIKWETVEMWDREHVEDSHPQIALKTMRGS
jgi:hypothetical protein